MTNKTIYLDNNATTPIDPDVVKAMEPYFKEYYFNPSSTYAQADFAEELDPDLNNEYGLCYYIELHPLLNDFEPEELEEISMNILGECYATDCFTFAGNNSQQDLSADDPSFYDRSEWCGRRLEELESP